MAHYVARIPVSVTRSAAFADLSRFDRAAEWDPGVESGEMLTPEPVGVGSRFRLVARFLGRRIPLDYEIVEYDRDERIVLRAENRSVRSVDTITFEDDERGTVMVYDAQLDAKGIGRLADPVLVDRLSSHRRSRRGRPAYASLGGAGVTRFDGARRLADAALEATVVGSFSRIGFAARRALFDWDAEPVVDMSGRVALVTGATGGLGLAAATALAQRNADIWIVGRDPQRIEAARRAIAGVAPDSSVTTAVADLAVLDDVRNLADRVRRSAPRLDVLIHNAGALTHDLRYTADGLEVTAQVHVVAPFLLTTALLPILQATPDARVITVSSGGMYTQRLDLDALATPAIPFNGVRAYANAKRAQVVLNELWSKHRAASGVVFHAMHPGWADTPGVRESLPRFHALMGPLLRTPSQGADTMVWLATDPRALETNGQFWLDRRPRSVAPLPGTRTSDADAERCWNWCVDRAGVAAPLEAAQ